MMDDEEELDLSAGMEPHPQTMPTHPAGKITGWDQMSGLPIVARHQPAESSNKPETNPVDVAPKAAAGETMTAKPEPKDAEPIADKPKSDKLKVGTPVKLPNGESGTVEYVEPKLGVVRVRTDGGKNLRSVRQNALQVLDHVTVREHVRRIPK